MKLTYAEDVVRYIGFNPPASPQDLPGLYGATQVYFKDHSMLTWDEREQRWVPGVTDE